MKFNNKDAKILSVFLGAQFNAIILIWGAYVGGDFFQNNTIITAYNIYFVAFLAIGLNFYAAFRILKKKN